MSQYNSSHFVVSQLEDGWMLQSDHVTKIQNGDWILNRDELEELSDLLKSVLTRSGTVQPKGEQRDFPFVVQTT